MVAVVVVNVDVNDVSAITPVVKTKKRPTEHSLIPNIMAGQPTPPTYPPRNKGLIMPY